jgi:1-acyl-sn-glycerol-3-phosphate acyltransferase
VRKLLETIKGGLSGIVILTHSVVLCSLVYLVGVFKYLAPQGPLRDRLSRVLAAIGEAWISVCSLVMTGVGVRPQHDIPDNLSREGCYLLNCNHQSWADIPVLQQAFNRKAPFMRFLVKRELIWVPFLGLAWWVMDFPFMARFSRSQISRNPGLRGKDLDTAREACERFATIPVSMMNFLEGTRFTAAKHQQQNSPYRHLLKPRVGGLGQVLYSLGDRLDSMIDVTIIYPDGRPSFWDLLSGRVQRVLVHAREVPIPDDLRGRNLRKDRGFRKDLEAWAQQLWLDKDQLIESLSNPAGTDQETA